ncbi:hypothetical protein ON010_g9002 [Phytophthora cinnamomi]|nr:hypothetical protein ON010_g9002 [Phytophthora cinnamomi]
MATASASSKLLLAGRDARALRGEQHDDREEQRLEREHADARRELVEVPGGTLGLGDRVPCEQRCHERRAHVDAAVLGDLADGDADLGARIDAQVARELVDEEARGGGAVLSVSAREAVPDHDHGNTARAAHEAEPSHVANVAAEEGRREEEHDEGHEHPVLHHRE